jgi:hypothetical protein
MPVIYQQIGTALAIVFARLATVPDHRRPVKGVYLP